MRLSLEGNYLRPFRYSDTVERDGWTMTFHSQHRPLEAYFLALEAAGLLVEVLREPEPVLTKLLSIVAARRVIDDRVGLSLRAHDGVAKFPRNRMTEWCCNFSHSPAATDEAAGSGAAADRASARNVEIGRAG
jgi:hypothetical protein